MLGWCPTRASESWSGTSWWWLLGWRRAEFEGIIPFLEASLNSTGWPRPEGVVNNINHGGERDSDRTRRCNLLDMESCCCCFCVRPVAGCHSATWNISRDFRERHQCVVLFLFLSNIKSILVTSCARKKNKIIRSNNWIKNCFHKFGNQYIKFYI